MVIKCPKCNHYVSDTTAVCPHCGAVLKEETSAQTTEPASAPQEEKPKTKEEEVVQPVNPPVEKPVEEPETEKPEKEEPVSPPPTSAPVAPPPVTYQQSEKSNITLISMIVVLLLLCGVGGILYLKNRSHTEDLVKVEKMYFESALGICSYTGTVDGDNLPHGTGEATFTDGRFYRGSFIHGNFNGNDVYFLYDNGDVFEGTFVDNKFSKGKYTIKSDGSYFEGSFENGQPNQGLWFDKDGKNLIGQ